MTEVKNCGGGHRTRLRDCLLYLWAAPAPVYKGGEEEAGQQGARQGEGSPTRTPVLVGFNPTLFSFYRRGKRGRRGSRRRKGGWRPLPKSNLASSLVGGVPAPCGLVSLPPMSHMAHIFHQGVSVTPPVLRYVPDTLRNPSSIRILPSNISILTSRPFRDFSSCP